MCPKRCVLSEYRGLMSILQPDLTYQGLLLRSAFVWGHVVPRRLAGKVKQEEWWKSSDPAVGYKIPQGSVHLLIFLYSALPQNPCEHTASSRTLVRQRHLKNRGRIKKKKVFELLILLFFPISTKNYFSRAGRCIFYFLRKIIGNMNPNTKSQPGIARRHPRVPYNCKN